MSRVALAFVPGIALFLEHLCTMAIVKLAESPYLLVIANFSLPGCCRLKDDPEGIVLSLLELTGKRERSRSKVYCRGLSALRSIKALRE